MGVNKIIKNKLLVAKIFYILYKVIYITVNNKPDQLRYTEHLLHSKLTVQKGLSNVNIYKERFQDGSEEMQSLVLALPVTSNRI